MEKKTKKETTEERVVVLEKGKAMDIGVLLAYCCGGTIMPFRGW